MGDDLRRRTTTDDDGRRWTTTGVDERRRTTTKNEDNNGEDDDNDMIVLDDHQETTEASQAPTFLQHLVHQQATFLQVKQELQEDLQEATNQAQQAQLDATDDSHLCVVCMDEERGVLYVPCNHLAVCVGCEEGLAAASMACPMCQEPIDRSRSISGIVVP